MEQVFSDKSQLVTGPRLVTHNAWSGPGGGDTGLCVMRSVSKYPGCSVLMMSQHGQPDPGSLELDTARYF